MRTRLLAAAAAATCLALALPAQAATGPQIKDAKGDGGPAGTDIVSVTFTSTFKVVRGVKKPTGFTVKMLLDAAPAQQTWFQVEVAKPGCPTYFFGYTTGLASSGGADCRDPQFNSTADPHVRAPTVSGSTITWRVPLASAPAGTKLKILDATNTVYVSVDGVATAGSPLLWDDAPARSGTTFTVGR